MSEKIEGCSDSFLADATAGVVANRRVKLLANRQIEHAGESEQEVGVTESCIKHDAAGTKYLWKVTLCNAPGSRRVELSGDTTRGALVKRQNLGKVGPGGSGSTFGISDGAGSAGKAPYIIPL